MVRRPSSVVRRPSSAFTLIELLVVILVIAVLAGITFPLFKYATQRANLAKQNIMLNNIKSALEDYRATYGEYPITPPHPGSERHYPIGYAYGKQTYDETRTNSPFTNIIFDGNTTKETCFSGNSIKFDYCLTYPLTLRQLGEGKSPLMQFDKLTAFYMVYRSTETQDMHEAYTPDGTAVGRIEGGIFTRVTTPGGFFRSIYGNPVNRYLATDPISGKQWKYVCTNGFIYAIWTNTF